MGSTEWVGTSRSYRNYASRPITVKFTTSLRMLKWKTSKLRKQRSMEGVTAGSLCRQQLPLLCSNELCTCCVQTEELDLEDGQWEDAHVITGALKLFFRELPEPLFPYSHFNRFITAISKQIFESNTPTFAQTISPILRASLCTFGLNTANI